MQRSALKRQKELARQQRQRDKAATRVQRKKEKETVGKDPAHEDSDISDIIPGPEPPAE
jgi:hypothetical protein